MHNLLQWGCFNHLERRWYSVQRSLIEDTDSINSPHEYELSNRKLKKRSFPSPIQVNLVFQKTKDFFVIFQRNWTSIRTSFFTLIYNYRHFSNTEHDKNLDLYELWLKKYQNKELQKKWYGSIWETPPNDDHITTLGNNTAVISQKSIIVP